MKEIDGIVEPKTVIYTAITGRYENLKEPRFISKECKYICFTNDKKIKSNTWEIRKIDNNVNDFVKEARKYKILPHLFLAKYENSIWIDGSILILGDIGELARQELKKNNMTFFKHPERKCIFQEAKICSLKEKDDPNIISNQMKVYKEEGFPHNQGLIASGVIIRRHNEDEVIKLMEDWWEQINSFSIRDQLSFNFVSWKNNSKYGLIDKNIFKNKYFKRILLGRQNNR